MGQEFLIDTNIVIDVFGDIMPNDIKQKVAKMAPVVSAVTYMEALGWHQITPRQMDVLKKFMNAAMILPISRSVMEETVRIRQRKKVGLGDAIIAATAIVHNRVLVTRNVADFKSIDNLIVFNPWER